MAEVQLITATRHDKTSNVYVGTWGKDGYLYFNDSDFYRVKKVGDKLEAYILSFTKHSWLKTTIWKSLEFDNINSGAGSIAPAGEGVEAAVKWMIAMSNDNSHGYDQANRWGPDYDCSSFVYEAFRIGGGFELPVHSGYTGSMIRDFTKIGFKWLPGKGNKASDCQRGDILLNIASHVEVYIGAQTNVGAHINEFGGIIGGQPGDQTGEEISKGAYYSFPWDGILRYTGK